jgi:hypothetical protein
VAGTATISAAGDSCMNTNIRASALTRAVLEHGVAVRGCDGSRSKSRCSRSVELTRRTELFDSNLLLLP